MKFSWLFAVINVILVVIGALITRWEGTFTHKQLGARSIPWLAHGGSWADLVIVTIVMGLIAPFVIKIEGRQILTYMVISFIISAICHFIWMRTQPIPGHICQPTPDHQGELPTGGIYHLVYMTLVLGALVAYYFNAQPSLVVSALMTVFVLPAILQPGWYISLIVNGHGRIDALGWATAAIVWIMIWTVTLLRN